MMQKGQIQMNQVFGHFSTFSFLVYYKCNYYTLVFFFLLLLLLQYVGQAAVVTQSAYLLIGNYLVQQQTAT